MSMSPTPEQSGSIQDKEMERNASACVLPMASAEPHLRYWMLTPSLLIALAGLVGNGLVLWLLGFRIERNPFSVYVLNLAGADALFLGCHFIMSLLEEIGYGPDCELDFVLDLFRSVFYTVGLSLLAAISTELCLSVLFPIWYRCHRPKHTSAMVCAVLWVLPPSCWLVFFILSVSRVISNISDSKITFLFIRFLLLTSILCVSSLMLLLRVQCSSLCRQPPSLYLVVLLNVLVFLLCGLPIGITEFLLHFHKMSIPLWIPWLLACVNSSANPFIYFLLGRQKGRRGRETLRIVLQRALRDEQELGGGSRGGPHISSLETSS